MESGDPSSSQTRTSYQRCRASKGAAVGASQAMKKRQRLAKTGARSQVKMTPSKTASVICPDFSDTCRAGRVRQSVQGRASVAGSWDDRPSGCSVVQTTSATSSNASPAQGFNQHRRKHLTRRLHLQTNTRSVQYIFHTINCTVFATLQEKTRKRAGPHPKGRTSKTATSSCVKRPKTAIGTRKGSGSPTNSTLTLTAREATEDGKYAG